MEFNSKYRNDRRQLAEKLKKDLASFESPTGGEYGGDTRDLLAKVEAEIQIISAVLLERQRCALILQNAFNVAEMEFQAAEDALRTAIGPLKELAAEKAKRWAVMFALQEARNAITERGE